MSLSRTGEVRKISPDGTQSTLSILCPSSTTRTAGIALDHQNNVYVVVTPCGTTGERGIWQITPHGQQQLAANLPTTARPNGIAYHEGWLYVADSRLTQVWRVHTDGQSPAEVWSTDLLLQHPPNPEPGIPGPNGLQVFDDEVYVSVSTRDHVVALPINEDGPTSAAFGVNNHKKDLYIANGALPQLPGPNPRRPSIMRLHVGVKGEPRP